MPKSINADPKPFELARRVFQRFGLLRRSEGGRGRADIEAWLTQRLADELELDPEEIDRDVPVDRYGLDSRTAASLSGELEDWLGRRIEATVMWEHPTIEQLSLHLTEADSADEADAVGPL
jgi:acyl carrier protein